MEITKPVIVMEMIIVGWRGLILSAHKPSQLELLWVSLSDSEISDLTTYIYYILQCTYDTHTHTNIVLLLQTLQGQRPRRLWLTESFTLSYNPDYLDTKVVLKHPPISKRPSNVIHDDNVSSPRSIYFIYHELSAPSMSTTMSAIFPYSLSKNGRTSKSSANQDSC